MSVRRDEVEKTFWQAYIRVGEQLIIAGRVFKGAPPTDEDLRELIVRFNYNKADEFMLGDVVVVETLVREVGRYGMSIGRIQMEVASRRKQAAEAAIALAPAEE